MERLWYVRAVRLEALASSVADAKFRFNSDQNSAYSRESGTASAASSDGADALSTAGRVASRYGIATTVMQPPAMNVPVYASASARRDVGGVTIGGNNSISLDVASSASSARKRPAEYSLSPLPSPLLSFLSPTLSSSASAAPGAGSMNQFDLSSSRVGSLGLLANKRELQATAVGNNSLKFVVPSGVKRVRREAPSSPRSVGEVAGGAPTRPSPALPPTAPSASVDKIRSVVRGLEHVSRCAPSGCGNPLCVSTRGFMNKVSAHLAAMANKPGHVADKCGACVLWNSIVRSHASICMEVDCSIPLCATANEKPGGVDSSTGCRPRDRRDDNDDQRRSLLAQQ